jgi:hypothetical protein
VLGCGGDTQTSNLFYFYLFVDYLTTLFSVIRTIQRQIVCFLNDELEKDVEGSGRDLM